MKDFLKNLRLFLWLTVLTGLIYPFFIWTMGYFGFHEKSQGSFIHSKGKVVGSRLIGQKFTSNRYFWGRPSAVDYRSLPSGASNLGPTSKVLQKLVKDRQEFLAERHHTENVNLIPSELLYASGSGLDPHLSPDAIIYQFDRVALARGYSSSDRELAKELITTITKKKVLHFIGEDTINVLELNLALDEFKKND